MDEAETTQNIPSQPTILRIKRKRTDEPLDALVVESKSRRKKSRGASGFFQFAETVEKETFWEDPNLTKDLRTRITSLASSESIAEKQERDPSFSPSTPIRRYTIIKNPSGNKSPLSPVTHVANQPKEAVGQDFTMYDAVPETGLSVNTTGDIDPHMEKFLPMLQEYLRMTDGPSNISSTSAKRAESGGEYVWDVFYHRPAITEWVGAANIATVSGLPSIGQYDSDSDSGSAGDEDDEDSNTEDFYRNDYPDEDPDQESDDDIVSSSASSDPEYLAASDEEDERDLNAFLAWRSRR